MYQGKDKIAKKVILILDFLEDGDDPARYVLQLASLEKLKS